MMWALFAMVFGLASSPFASPPPLWPAVLPLFLAEPFRGIASLSACVVPMDMHAFCFFFHFFLVFFDTYSSFLSEEKLRCHRTNKCHGSSLKPLLLLARDALAIYLGVWRLFGIIMHKKKMPTLLLPRREDEYKPVYGIDGPENASQL